MHRRVVEVVGAVVVFMGIAVLLTNHWQLRGKDDPSHDAVHDDLTRRSLDNLCGLREDTSITLYLDLMHRSISAYLYEGPVVDDWTHALPTFADWTNGSSGYETGTWYWWSMR